MISSLAGSTLEVREGAPVQRHKLVFLFFFSSSADLKKMLTPGFSLGRLGETVGLEDTKKGIFPHDLVKGDDCAFLDEPELPADPEAWFSRVYQCCPTKKQVDEAREEFRRRGFRSVREYMLFYLRCDLEVLLHSTERLFRKLEEIVGLSPVSVNKFSLSGYSLLAGQYRLVRDLRPGMFTCNHAALYSALRRGMRGGVSLVCRNAAGDQVPLGQAGINAHLTRGADPLTPSEAKLYTLYYDIVSLYPSAGESPLASQERDGPPTNLIAGGVGRWPTASSSRLPPSCPSPPPTRTGGPPSGGRNPPPPPTQWEEEGPVTGHTGHGGRWLLPLCTIFSQPSIHPSIKNCSVAGLEAMPFGPCTMFTLDEEDGYDAEVEAEEADRGGSPTQGAPSTRSGAGLLLEEEEEWEGGTDIPEQQQQQQQAQHRGPRGPRPQLEEEGGPWASGRCRSPSDCAARHVHRGSGSNELRRLTARHEVGANMLSRLESQWQQWKVLEFAAQREREGKPKPLLACGNVFAGHGQPLWGSNYRQRVDLAIVSDPGVIRLYNFHGSYYHYRGHQDECPRARTTGVGFALNQDTVQGDNFKRLYAETMTEVGGGRVQFIYESETECDVFHQKSVKSAKDGQTYRSVLAALRRVHRDDCVLPPTFGSISQAALLARIMKEDPNLDGFVTIEGGTCNHFGDKLGSQFSFCIQRAKPRLCELGEFTLEQLREASGGDEVAYRKKLDSMANTPLTLCKHYYEDHGETIGIPLLRWLVRERGLRGFRVRHLLLYNGRDYYRSFLRPLLQLRHDVKRGSADVPQGGISLLEQVIKLLLNGESKLRSCSSLPPHSRHPNQLVFPPPCAGWYGSAALDPTNYCKTTVLTDRALSRRKERYRNAVGLCLVGVRDRSPPRPRGNNPRGATATVAAEVPRATANPFVDTEAAEAGGDGTSSEDGEEEEQQQEEEEEEEIGPDLDLLYALTERNKDAKIRNLLQLSACILSWSKLIFFHKVNWLLSVADREKVETMYCDTDSIVLAATEKKFQDCVLPEMRRKYEAEKGSVFVDPASPVTQCGLLKDEFQVWN